MTSTLIIHQHARPAVKSSFEKISKILFGFSTISFQVKLTFFLPQKSEQIRGMLSWQKSTTICSVNTFRQIVDISRAGNADCKIRLVQNLTTSFWTRSFLAYSSKIFGKFWKHFQFQKSSYFIKKSWFLRSGVSWGCFQSEF